MSDKIALPNKVQKYGQNKPGNKYHTIENHDELGMTTSCGWSMGLYHLTFGDKLRDDQVCKACKHKQLKKAQEQLR